MVMTLKKREKEKKEKEDCKCITTVLRAICGVLPVSYGRLLIRTPVTWKRGPSHSSSLQWPYFHIRSHSEVQGLELQNIFFEEHNSTHNCHITHNSLITSDMATSSNYIIKMIPLSIPLPLLSLFFFPKSDHKVPKMTLIGPICFSKPIAMAKGMEWC